jgi:hypothetical protein
MDCKNTLRQCRRWIGHLSIAAVAALACTAHADQLEEHNLLVQQFITELHANPLAADCAAHAAFVVSTSTLYDHVEFPPSSFDPAHVEVKPWNDAFSDGKQRIKVDTMVEVGGFGIRKTSQQEPDSLKFQCGYVAGKMLAFSWNDPVPPLRPKATKARRGKHGTHKGKAGRARHKRR